MCRILFVLLCWIVLLAPLRLIGQVSFDQYFLPKTFRVDLVRTANSRDEMISIHAMKEEPFWGGSKTQLVDSIAYGQYFFEVEDLETGRLIYSRGYSSLCREWQMLAEAQTSNRSFFESIVFPFPREDFLLRLKSRDKMNIFQTVLEKSVHVQDYTIYKESSVYFRSKKMVDNGLSEKKLDIVFLPEGYKRSQMAKFKRDVKRFVDHLLEVEPFKTHNDLLNIWMVKAPSLQSGVDSPGMGVYRNTLLNASFDTFGSERYLTSFDVFAMRDVAANVPYDQIVILVNTDKYGGGGVYNQYSICSVDNQYSKEVYTHEFGHAFADLADEYFVEGNVYGEYYNINVEPYQPNITTLHQFEKKWKDLLSDSIPVPTPAIEPYIKGIGVFEGGGYLAKGIYRSEYNCKMRTNSINSYCLVCRKAIFRMLKFYSD